ncbi:MAG: DeoR family transcriptional regulator, partial [Erysipelotrichaceae bacterium]|nr:DeoR family transcriptional regulator [Erysipelotrichaceae bacterium]
MLTLSYRGIFMSKKKEERLTAILQLITEKEQLDVTSLASHFNVSQVTMRKDL